MNKKSVFDISGNVIRAVLRLSCKSIESALEVITTLIMQFFCPQHKYLHGYNHFRL